MSSRSDGVPALVARHVSKHFLIRHNSAPALKDRVLALLDRRRRERVETFWALRDVSLTVQPGEAIGLVPIIGGVLIVAGALAVVTNAVPSRT